MNMRRVLAVAGIVTLLATSAACSTKDSSASGGTSGVKITLAFSAWPGWFPWQVAEEKGLFKANYANVELKYFDDYVASLTALSTGKTVAVEQGTVDHFLLLLALQKAGLTGNDVTIKALPTADAAAAFKAGQVDAVGAFAPFTTTALERSGSKTIATSKDFPGSIPDHLVFDAKFVAAHPTEVQAVVKTWFDTIKWISENKDAAIAIMAKRGGVSVDDYKSYDAGTTIFTKEQNLAAFAAVGS
ncbi:MAG: NitT/TauT family transport system substrate-binding protein [Micromonosporaceae bacterium]|jgi:NitT/TauT family transport system substrate-binding protein|nr:NitT/TauT family transport system substrate-binding protein [Micromonosporaceae bacterium]